MILDHEFVVHRSNFESLLRRFSNDRLLALKACKAATAGGKNVIVTALHLKLVRAPAS